MEQDKNLQKVEVIFSTSNKWKIEQFKMLNNNRLNEFFDIKFEKVPDVPEIQGTCEEVAIDKVLSAYKYLQKPCMVDDESLSIDSLNGFPGPYLKDFEAHLKAEGVYKVLSSLGSDVCYPTVYYAITFDGKKVYTFNGKMKAVSIKPREEFAQEKEYYEVLYSVDWNVRLSELTPEIENSKYNNRMIAIEKMIEFFKENAISKL